MQKTISQFRLTQWTDARSFLAEAQAFLSEDEVVHAVILGISQSVAKSSKPDQAKNFFGLVYENDQPVIAAFRTPPHGLALTPGPREAMNLLARAVIKKYGCLPGANGPKPVVDAFSEAYCALSGQRAQVDLEMRIHRLDMVAELKLAEGQLRRARPTDVDLLHTWMNDFSNQTLGRAGPSHEEVLDQLKQPDPRFYLWCIDGDPVSTAAWSRPTQNGISVNAVYTPMNKRGRGYGTAVVHELSSLLLKRGYSFCTLYTDLANPTSNAIYARIGYVPVIDTRNMIFVSTDPKE